MGVCRLNEKAMAGIGSRKPIKIVDVTPAKNGSGHMKATSTVLFSGWAEVSDPSSGRNFFNGKDSLDYTKRFRIRATDEFNVTVNTRIIYAGKKYTVSGVERENEKLFYYIIRAAAEDAGIMSTVNSS